MIYKTYRLHQDVMSLSPTPSMCVDVSGSCQIIATHRDKIFASGGDFVAFHHILLSFDK